MSAVATFAAAAAALYVAHEVADHWVQTDHQAQRKTLPGRDGWAACSGHVAGYLATQLAALLAVAAVTGMPLPAAATAAALAISGGTHWFFDRRWPLRRAADALGKAGFYDAGPPPVGSGAYKLDQSAHLAFSVFTPALIIAAAAA